MKTTLDAVNKIVARLKGNTALMSSITGGVYKTPDLINDGKENFWVNSLPINNEQLQGCVININAYCPKKAISVDSVTQKVVDLQRLKEMTDIVIPLVDKYWSEDYHSEVQQQNILFDQSTGEYFSNIRIEFYFENV